MAVNGDLHSAAEDDPVLTPLALPMLPYRDQFSGYRVRDKNAIRAVVGIFHSYPSHPCGYKGLNSGAAAEMIESAYRQEPGIETGRYVWL